MGVSPRTIFDEMFNRYAIGVRAHADGVEVIDPQIDIRADATWACPSGSRAFALPTEEFVAQKRGNHPDERGGGANINLRSNKLSFLSFDPVQVIALGQSGG